jgi:hypothetical protein
VDDEDYREILSPEQTLPLPFQFQKQPQNQWNKKVEYQIRGAFKF